MLYLQPCHLEGPGPWPVQLMPEQVLITANLKQLVLAKPSYCDEWRLHKIPSFQDGLNVYAIQQSVD